MEMVCMCATDCFKFKKYFFEFLRSRHGSSGAARHIEQKKRDFAPSNFWRGFQIAAFTLQSAQTTVNVH